MWPSQTESEASEVSKQMAVLNFLTIEKDPYGSKLVLLILNVLCNIKYFEGTVCLDMSRIWLCTQKELFGV